MMQKLKNRLPRKTVRMWIDYGLTESSKIEAGVGNRDIVKRKREFGRIFNIDVEGFAAYIVIVMTCISMVVAILVIIQWLLR